MAFNDTLFQLGMDLTRSSTAQKEDHSVVESVTAPAVRKDRSLERDTSRFAGQHLIIDLYGAQGLDDIKSIERILRACAAAAEGTLARVHLHRGAHGGVTGLAVLAEGHISVQTRPDTGFAAFDVLMAGNAKPQRCVEDLREAFFARDVAVKIVERGSETATFPSVGTGSMPVRLKAVRGGKKAKAA